MKVFICIDKDGGMMFNHRRQSRDRTVVEDVIRHISDRRLYICPYSKELFSRYGNIIVSDAPLAAAGGEDCCFIENTVLAPYRSKISELIVYNWNRAYPSDLKLDISLLPDEWELFEEIELHGFSHEKITKGVYRKR